MTYEYQPTESDNSILNIAARIEELENPEEIKIAVKELLEHLETDLNLKLTENIEDLYKEMQTYRMLARLESVKKVVECLEAHTPIEVGKGGAHYANCVVPETEGLKIAYSEGEAHGPIRLVVGVDVKALIGFNNDHINVFDIEEAEDDLRDSTLRKAYCRHIEGEILSDDIKYMILRIPRKLFPDDHLTPEEASGAGKFIFRGSRVNQLDARENISQAA